MADPALLATQPSHAAPHSSSTPASPEVRKPPPAKPSNREVNKWLKPFEGAIKQLAGDSEALRRILPDHFWGDASQGIRPDSLTETEFLKISFTLSLPIKPQERGSSMTDLSKWTDIHCFVCAPVVSSEIPESGFKCEPGACRHQCEFHHCQPGECEHDCDIPSDNGGDRSDGKYSHSGRADRHFRSPKHRQNIADALAIATALLPDMAKFVCSFCHQGFGRDDTYRYHLATKHSLLLRDDVTVGRKAKDKKRRRHDTLLEDEECAPRRRRLYASNEPLMDGGSRINTYNTPIWASGSINRVPPSPVHAGQDVTRVSFLKNGRDRYIFGSQSTSTYESFDFSAPGIHHDDDITFPNASTSPFLASFDIGPLTRHGASHLSLYQAVKLVATRSYRMATHDFNDAQFVEFMNCCDAPCPHDDRSASVSLESGDAKKSADDGSGSDARREDIVRSADSDSIDTTSRKGQNVVKTIDISVTDKQFTGCAQDNEFDTGSEVTEHVHGGDGGEQFTDINWLNNLE